jgi:hypothetical protein
MSRPTRRELLQGAMALALAGSNSVRAAAPPWPASALAAACRAAHPALSVPLAMQQRWQQTAAADLPALLRRQIGADFANGRVRDVAGWQLSETECVFALWLEHL